MNKPAARQFEDVPVRESETMPDYDEPVNGREESVFIRLSRRFEQELGEFESNLHDLNVADLSLSGSHPDMEEKELPPGRNVSEKEDCVVNRLDNYITILSRLNRKLRQTTQRLKEVIG